MFILERTISSEERIKRAEEIYLKRRNNQNRGNVRVSSSNVNSSIMPNFSLYKKLILQICICLLIYFIFFLIKNSNYIFSEEVIKKVEEFLNHDVNFVMLYESGKEFYEKNIHNFFNKLNKVPEEENKKANTITENVITNNIIENTVTQNIIDNVNAIENVAMQNNIENVVEQNIEETGIGGEEVAEPIKLSQMEIDANEIKNNYNIIVPLEGYNITSQFGPREATEIISANHGGIDLGVDEGTVFVASMSGTVTYLSSEGDYGLHVWIQDGDVETLYAHCKNIYVQEGQQIKQGDKIGEVGSTGRATRTTFTF